MSDLEKANAGLSATDVRVLFAGAIVDGRVEVLEPHDDEGNGFLYSRTGKKR